VRIWDPLTHERVAELRGHTGLVLHSAFSADGKTLATCATDDSVKFWDTTTWKEELPPLGQREYVSSLAFSPDRRTLATACSDGTMKLWNVATHRELASVKLGMYGFHITFSPDGQTLAAWNPYEEGGLLRLWRAPVTELKRP
jgi:WD40 repeat protein